MRFLSRLLSPCMFGHSREWSYAPGLQTKLCLRCQQPIGTVLAGEMITTPLPQVVSGTPAIKAKRKVKDNVAPMRVSNR